MPPPTHTAMTTAMTPSVWTTEPFRIGTPEQFARLRELFVRSGFEEAPICARAEIETIHDLPPFDDRTALKDVADAQTLLVRLFMDCDAVSREAVRSVLSDTDIQTLETLGLL